MNIGINLIFTVKKPIDKTRKSDIIYTVTQINRIGVSQMENIKTYKMTVAGVERDLPVCPINDELEIAAFVIFGDVELTCKCAEALIKEIPEHDIMIAAEAKSIPLIHEMARQMGVNEYIIARKVPKLYMHDPISVSVKSITTEAVQTLYIDKTDAAKMKDKRVLIVDDVISTGKSVQAVEKLVEMAGGNIVGKAAILAEGDAKDRKDLIFLAPLPLFIKDKKGE